LLSGAGGFVVIAMRRHAAQHCLFADFDPAVRRSFSSGDRDDAHHPFSAPVVRARAGARQRPVRQCIARLRDWFRSQKSPKTGALCCNEADGLFAEEDIRDGHYWARWSGHDWLPVPDEVVIHDPNRHGAPVVWWYVERGVTKIRCYAPGGGV
jgi:hypothetical protein